MDLAAGSLLGPAHELAVGNGEVAALHDGARKDELVSLDGERAHCDSPLENGPGRLPGPTESVSVRAYASNGWMVTPLTTRLTVPVGLGVSGVLPTRTELSRETVCATMMNGSAR